MQFIIIVKKFFKSQGNLRNAFKNKSIWYENVTLYKQKQIGNWEEVFKNIRKDLEKNFMQG